MDVTSCWDDNMLHGCREEIIRLSRRCSRCHEYCCRFLAAAGSLAGDTYRIALDGVNTAKLAGYCGRLAEREYKPWKKAPGVEQVRFLTAVTNKGVWKSTDTAKRLCDRIYLINDESGAVSRLLLGNMRRDALAAGYDVISCYCPLSPFEKLEQLFIPELRLGFMTSNRFHDFSLEIDPYRIVNAQRFTDPEKVKSGKKRLNFNRKVMAQMIDQAQLLLKEAKSVHDELEGYYISATDFKKVEALTQTVLSQVESFEAY